MNFSSEAWFVSFLSDPQDVKCFANVAEQPIAQAHQIYEPSQGVTHG